MTLTQNMRNNNSAGGFQWLRIMDGEEVPISVSAVKHEVAVPARAVFQYSLDGELIAQFDTIAAASRAVGVDTKGIRSVLNGKQKKAGGFIWKEM